MNDSVSSRPGLWLRPGYPGMSVSLQIGGIVVRVATDHRVRFLDTCQFAMDCETLGDDRTDVSVTIQGLVDCDAEEPPLTRDERELLVASGGCRERWLDSAAARNPLVVQSLRACTSNPEMCDLEFAWDRVIVCNFAERWANILYPPTRCRKDTDELFMAGLRNLLGRFFPLFGATLVHGAGAVLDGRVALVVAPDGGGKTTLVRSLPDAAVLSDDHVVVRPQVGGGGRIASTPFGSRTSGPAWAPLGGLFLLSKAASPAVRPADRETALSWLLDGPQRSWLACPPPLRARAFGIMVDILRDVPLYRLEAPLEFADWRMLAERMC